MKDHRRVDELTVEELEEILRLRKRQERVERLRQAGKKNWSALDPLAPQPVEPLDTDQAEEYRRFLEESARLRAAQRRRGRGIRWDWVRDKSLLVIEISALVALVLVLLTMTSTVRELNQEASQAQQLPTLTPTPLIQVVLLPGGHTPPDAQGESAPDEIPAHLRDRVTAITPRPAPTPGPEQAQRIVIPSIRVDAPVIEGDDWESLKRGAGHHIGSANPGERGNCVISAHNDIYGEIFRHLPDLSVGAEVLLYTNTQVYRYVVTQQRITRPTDVEVMAPTQSPILTLISCYPYGIDTHRIVVVAELQP